MKRTLLLSALAAFALGASTRAQAVTGVVAFGDSLSDNGNLFAVTGFPGFPYWRGRFSNGPVWIERVAPRLGVASPLIQDWAVGGATSGDVLSFQVLPYLAANGTVPDDTLVTLWAGANDLLDLLDDPNQDPNELIAEAVTNIGTSLTLLLMAGADDVVVVNLPDLGLTPGVTSLGDPAAVLLANALSQAFNAALDQVVDQVELAFGVDLVEVDAFALLTDAVANPSTYGFVNVTESAYDSRTGAVDPEEARFLFWDEIHPTTRAHRALAGVVLAALRARR